MRKLARRTVAIIVSVLALIGIGVAYAAWTASGSGSATATAGSATQLTVTGTTASGLYPTGQVSVPFTVKNPNPYAVTLATAKASNFSVDAGHSTCTVGSVSGVDLTGLTDVAGANSSTTVSKNMVIKMDNTANDACQGATFSFTITVTGASS